MLAPRPMTVVAFCVGCFVAATSLEGRSDAPISLVLGIALVAVIAYGEGLRLGTDMLDQMTARLRDETEQIHKQTAVIKNADVTFHQSDDGSTHALVTLENGGVRAIPIPEEHLWPPHAAVIYVAKLIASEVDE